MRDTTVTDAPHDLGHYTRPLRRHKALIAVFLVLGLALGIYASTTVHPSYVSSARVLVLTDITDQGVGNAANGRTANAVNLDTEAQLAKSEPLAARVKHMLGTAASPQDLINRLTITVPANTTVLNLTFKAPTAAAAQAGAAAFATAYLQNRAAVAQANLKIATTAVTNQITSAEDKLRKLTDAIAIAPSGSAIESFEQGQKVAQQAQINNLEIQLNTLTTAPVTPGRVISPASAGTKQTLKREVIIVSGALLGLLIGVIAAVLRDRTGRTVRSRDDLTEARLHIVGDDTQRVGSGRRHRNRPSRAPHQAATAIASGVDPGEVVYIAGVSSASVGSRVARQIAEELRRFGDTVLTIQVKGGTGSSADAQLLKSEGYEPVDRAGSVVALAGLRAAGLKAQIEASRDRVDYVLITGGDAGSDSEAYLVASSADATLLVAEAGVTGRQDLRGVADEVRLTPTHLLGAVLVRRGRDPLPTETATVGDAGDEGPSRRPVDRSADRTSNGHPAKTQTRGPERLPVRKE